MRSAVRSAPTPCGHLTCTPFHVHIHSSTCKLISALIAQAHQLRPYLLPRLSHRLVRHNPSSTLPEWRTWLARVYLPILPAPRARASCSKLLPQAYRPARCRIPWRVKPTETAATTTTTTTGATTARAWWITPRFSSGPFWRLLPRLEVN